MTVENLQDNEQQRRIARILVVDDEPDLEHIIRQRFRRYIRDGQYEFLFASNGAQALDVLEEHEDVSLVLSDINMPEMDGLTLLERLGGFSRLIRTVIISAYGDMENIRLAMNRGAFDFLTKPIDLRDLELTVQKTLDDLSARKEAEEARRQLLTIEEELGIAARIQQSILPRSSPKREDIEIHGAMVPARAVGGDFYDYFPVGEDELAIVIGDVSGKGIGAAILMAESRTLIKAVALQGRPPAECLEFVNAALAEEDDSGLFLTAFLGVLNVKTGELTFSNGGHPPPMRIQKGRDAELLRIPSGIVVGAFDGMSFPSERIRLERGDTLLLYTDGITEAMNPQEEMFGEGRTLRSLSELNGTTPKGLIDSLFETVRTFTENAPQSDDLTALALRFGENPGG